MAPPSDLRSLAAGPSRDAKVRSVAGEAPALRPRTVGEILDASFTLYRNTFGTMLLSVTVLSLPVLVLAIVLSRGAGSVFQDYLGAAGDYMRNSIADQGRPSRATTDAMMKLLDSSVGMWVYSAAGAALQAISRGTACVAGAIVAWPVLLGQPVPRTGEIIRRTLPWALPATVVHFVIALASLVTGACCLTIPLGIILGAILAPACAILVVERPQNESGFGPRSFASAFAAMGRCFRLSMDGSTIARGTLFVFTILTFVFAVVGVMATAATVLSKSFGVAFVLQHYAEVIFLPAVGIGFTVWYADLRVRREAMDFDTGETA